MAKRRSHRRTRRHVRHTRRASGSKKPIGFIKVSGKYRFAFRASKNAKGKNIVRTKTGRKVRLGKGFKTKTALAKHFVSKYRRR